jgi:processing peptidase subunit alpha
MKQSRSMSELAAPPVTQGILESFFGKSSMPIVPLNHAYAGAPQLSEGAAVDSKIEVTTLPSGLRVVSTETNNPIVSVGAFIDAGSRYENANTSGISHFLEHVAFKSTENRSDFKLVRDMLQIGANVACTTSREHTVYAADVLREHVSSAVHTLGDVIQNPAFDLDEMDESVKIHQSLCAELTKSPDTKIMESIHAAAYHNNTVGLPLYGKSVFSKEDLQAHMKAYYTPERMVVSGVGVNHSKFVDLVGTSFGGLSKGPTPATEKARYTGGEVQVPNAAEGLTHVALAFETANWHSKDLVPMCVLQMMMGGGGSFSAGGPGKGMYSRLYQNMLNQHYWIESANCFNSIFTDSAIFGLYGTAAPEHAGQLMDQMTAECLHMAGKVDPNELSRAKNQLKSSVHMQLEARSLQLEDQGRQLITYGKIMTPAELCAQVDAVKDSDIQRVATAMLKTPLSLATYGDLSNVVRYDDLAKRFG